MSAVVAHLLSLFLFLSPYSFTPQPVQIPLGGVTVTPAVGCSFTDTDSFAGTAGTHLPSYNAKWKSTNWSGSHNDLQISNPNGGVSPSSGPSADYDTNVSAADSCAQVTVNTLPTTLGYVILRGAAGTGNKLQGYGCGSNNSAHGTYVYEIARFDASTRTMLQAYATVMATSDVMKCTIVGTTITLYVNGVAQSPTVTDATYSAAGNPGMDVQASSTTANYFGSWSAGTD